MMAGEVEIYGDSRVRGFCHRCRADIIWATRVGDSTRVAFDEPLIALAAREINGRVIERVRDVGTHRAHVARKAIRLYG